jgi:nicotinamide-nucleotide amidase
MNLELITTGTELLLGSVLNTHVRFLAEQLFPLGLRIDRQTTVPDGPAIGTLLRESFPRCDILIVTGGLGPTTDDVTRDEVAALLELPLVHDESVMEAIRARFARRNLTMSPRVALQALRPNEARVLPNSHGTAPGLYLAPRIVPSMGRLSPHLFLLPGPPRELKPMVVECVLPILREILPPQPDMEIRTYRVCGLGESMVEERLGERLLSLGLEVGYCARPGEVDLRLIGSTAQLAAAEPLVVEAVGAFLYSKDGNSLEETVVHTFSERGLSLATAESCTGGTLANRLTNVPGSSKPFLCGFVTYSNAAKIRDLEVPEPLLREHGAVSQPVVESMALGALRRSGADYAVATTGIAGPGGGTDQKPVGLVYIGVASRDGKVLSQRHLIPTERETFKGLVAQAAFRLLLDRLRESFPENPPSPCVG